MRELSSHLGAGLYKQAIWPGGDRAWGLGGRSGRSTSRVRARAAISGRRQTGLAQNARSIHDWVVRRVETARISLTHTPRFRLAPCVGQNGARPDIGRFCTGEYALGALEGRFGFPGRSVGIGGHRMPLLGEFTGSSPKLTQVSRRCSACPTPTSTVYGVSYSFFVVGTPPRVVVRSMPRSRLGMLPRST